MKKNLYVILGTTAVLATAIAVAACATKKNTAKAAAQPQLRETIAKETIAPDDGQNPVMNFIGNYYGGRACVKTAPWGRHSRTTPRFPRHPEMRAFVSCMA